MKEHPLKIVQGDPAEVAKLLKDKDVRVVHRFKDTLIVVGEEAPNLTGELSHSVRAVPVESLVNPPADVSDKDIGLLAFRTRQTGAYRSSKSKRASEGEDWGSIFERM